MTSELFKRVDSIIIPNYHNYWVNPIINKYMPGALKSYEGTLILRKNKKAVFISHPFNYAQAKKVFGKNTLVVNYNDGKGYGAALKKYCGKKIGFDGKYNSVNMLKCMKGFFKGRRVKWFNVAKELSENREIKEVQEVECIKKAVDETIKVIKKAMAFLHKGVSEIEVEKFFRKEFERDGFETAFCIVAFGKNASNLHHVPSETKLQNGEGVLIDVGAKYKGYCADISESSWFGEKSGRVYEEYSNKFIEVQDSFTKIKKILKPNTKASDLWAVVKKLKLPHALGHGLGLEEHDIPAGIGASSKWKLKEGMVLAIEPGYYTKEFGIRVERNYLITKKGFKEL